MAQRADDWRENDLNGRFALGPPHDELTELGQTLDRMLERIAQVILTERRLTDEVAHELRNPITVIRAEAQLALREPVLSTMARESWRVIDQTCDVGDLFEEVRRQAASRPGVSVDVEHAGGRLSVPMHMAAGALKPVVDNAVRHARTTVTLTARAKGARILLIVENDGEGVPADQVDMVFKPGWTSSADGAGLGLSLARRLTSSLGGTLRAVPADHGRFVADLPAA